MLLRASPKLNCYNPLNEELFLTYLRSEKVVVQLKILQRRVDIDNFVQQITPLIGDAIVQKIQLLHSGIRFDVLNDWNDALVLAVYFPESFIKL